MIGKPIIPKEHGAWAVLFVPMAIAAALEERISVNFIILALASLSVFLAYHPIQIILRNTIGAKQPVERVMAARTWAALYLITAAFLGGILLYQGFRLLAPIGLLGAALFVLNFFLTRIGPKSVSSDFSAVAGLTLTGPSASYVLTGDLTAGTVSAWLLTILFFGSSVFYVHMKIAATGFKRESMSWRDRFSVGQLNLLYHVVVLVILFVLIANRFTPLLAMLAFVPIFLHAVFGTIRLSSGVRFKRLGFLLLGHSLIFGVLLSWMYS